jgi:methionyl aminopeptidase
MMPKPLSSEQIKLMEKAGKITGDTLTLLGKYVKPGITTRELAQIANDYILSQNATPTFYQYNGFDGYICTSVDDVVVHGIPNDTPLIEGQIVSLDCGATYNGYVGDSTVTYPVGQISPEKQRLLKITEEALYKGIEQAINGAKTYDIARAVQEYAEAAGYSLTRELTGHGVGHRLHLEPAVPNFIPSLLERRRMPNAKLYDGLGIAIEPMVHLGKKEIYVDADGWTTHTRDGSPAAHFEHTIIVNGNKPIITTRRD